MFDPRQSERTTSAKQYLHFVSALIFTFWIGAFVCSCATKHRSPSSTERRWFHGFDNEISGETISYHSPLPAANSALLVRSLDKDLFMEWETEPLPEKISGDMVSFVWLAAIDVNSDAHVFDFFINEEKWFSFSNPADRDNRHWQLEGDRDVTLEYRITSVDRYEDFMGFMFLHVPQSLFPAGQPLRLRVQGESAGSRSWFMVFKWRVEPRLTLFSEQAVLRAADRPHQTIRVEIVHLGDPVQAAIKTGNRISDSPLQFGHNVFRIRIPAVSRSETLKFRVDIPGYGFLDEDILIQPVKHKDIYLLHHSHVDIGYTHIQEEVKQIQTQNIERALELVARTRDYPEGSRFKWNTEVMWPVEEFWDYATSEAQNELIPAIQNGSIGIDALYANVLTGLCHPEELMHLFDSARKASQEYGTPIDSAMITDIPGYTWGLVPALVQNGINYLSIGANSGHRIGHILSTWADKPFYWVSPSRKEKVLCWVHGKGYSWFHTGLGYSKLERKLQETPIFSYLSELELNNYPYDIVAIRYNIGSDNGPPDTQLSDTVRDWNEKYISPKMIIATTSEMFHAFENRYEASIPEYRGDFTGYWEDGAASSARETALNKRAAERLVQAETLWTLRDGDSFPSAVVEDIWQNILLYSEHTWGSWNSISDPHSDFTLNQWKTKQSFAHNADRLSRKLMEDIAGFKGDSPHKIQSLDVYNTTSWKRTDVVLIPDGMSLAGDRIVDEEGHPLPSQRLWTGELAFLIEDVPPLGAKRVFFQDKPAYSRGQARAEENRLSNDWFSLQIDEKAGTIRNFMPHHSQIDLAGKAFGNGLNEFLYVAGRDPGNPMLNKNVSLQIRDKGPLVASVAVISDAPGCNALNQEIRIYAGLERVDIFNRIDKTNIYDPESVHFAFPFSIPGGQVRLDVAWGFYRPEHDQIPGANKNYFSIQRWADVSNSDYGVTWVSCDAPLIEVGSLTNDPVVYGWKKNVEPSQTLYSYVMNNYWETNYKASQGGLVTFRYSLIPHREFNPSETERRAVEISQPLRLVKADKPNPQHSFLELDSLNVCVTSIKPSKDGRAVMLRLFNTGESEGNVHILWGQKKPESLYWSSPFEEKGERIEKAITLPALGSATLRAENFK